MLHILLLVIGALVAGETPVERSAIDRDLELFQGEWSAVSGIVNGKDMEPDHLDATIIFKGNCFTFKQDKWVNQGTFELHAADNRKTIALKFNVKEGATVIVRIYQVNEQELTLYGKDWKEPALEEPYWVRFRKTR